MASHVSSQDVGDTLMFLEARSGCGLVDGGVARRGRAYLSPLRPCTATPPACCHAPGRWRWGVALSACWGAVRVVGLGRAGGEGAPPDAA